MLCAYHDITEVTKIVKQIVHDECLLLSVVYDWFIIFIKRERLRRRGWKEFMLNVA